MRNKENEKYVKLGVTALVVIILGVAAYYIMSKIPAISSFFGSVMKILMPFIYGAVIAYLLAPLCNRLEKLVKNSALSIMISLVAALLVIIVLLILVIPNVVESILQIIAALPTQLNNAAATLHTLLEEQPELQATFDEITSNINARVTSWIQTDLSSTLTALLNSLSGQVMGLVTLFKNVFLGILVSVYMLANRRKFAVQARMLLCGIFPKKWADMIEEEVRYADRMFNGFLVGRIIDSAIVGVICFIFCWICRFDSAVLVSVIVGVTNIIPVFGPFLGAIPSALFLVLENPIHCLIFLIFIVVLQQVDGNVIGPRILGQTTGVNSFWVLFAVMLFGGLWGLPGMIVGVPVFAVIYDIVKKLAYYGLGRHGRDDLLPKADEPSAGKETAGTDIDMKE